MVNTIEKDSNRFVLLYEINPNHPTPSDFDLLESTEADSSTYGSSSNTNKQNKISANIIKQEKVKIYMNVNSNYNIIYNLNMSQTKKLNIPKWKSVEDTMLKTTIIQEIFDITARRILKAFKKNKIYTKKPITQEIIIFSKPDTKSNEEVIYYSVHGDFLNVPLFIFDINKTQSTEIDKV